MSVYFISDPHLGHRNIAKFRSFVSSTEDNTAQFLDQWERHVHKRDVVYLLGDVAFDLESLDLLRGLRGRKILIKGNHDDMVPTSAQAEVFEEIHGMLKYKSMWLTHCPIHPVEMRERRGNVHGHVHEKTIPDERYVNACVDAVFPDTGSWFLPLDEVKRRLKF